MGVPSAKACLFIESNSAARRLTFPHMDALVSLFKVEGALSGRQMRENRGSGKLGGVGAAALLLRPNPGQKSAVAGRVARGQGVQKARCVRSPGPGGRARCRRQSLRGEHRDSPGTIGRASDRSSSRQGTAAAVAAGIRARGGGNLAPRDLAMDVVLRAVEAT